MACFSFQLVRPFHLTPLFRLAFVKKGLETQGAIVLAISSTSLTIPWSKFRSSSRATTRNIIVGRYTESKQGATLAGEPFLTLIVSINDKVTSTEYQIWKIKDRKRKLYRNVVFLLQRLFSISPTLNARPQTDCVLKVYRSAPCKLLRRGHRSAFVRLRVS